MSLPIFLYLDLRWWPGPSQGVSQFFLEKVELGKKQFKYLWKCSGETMLTGKILTSNPVRSSPKKQEVSPNVKYFQEVD